jgi:hypothetical protein
MDKYVCDYGDVYGVGDKEESYGEPGHWLGIKVDRRYYGLNHFIRLKSPKETHNPFQQIFSQIKSIQNSWKFKGKIMQKKKENEKRSLCN